MLLEALLRMVCYDPNNRHSLPIAGLFCLPSSAGSFGHANACSFLRLLLQMYVMCLWLLFVPYSFLVSVCIVFVIMSSTSTVILPASNTFRDVWRSLPVSVLSQQQRMPAGSSC